jgi:hypothetical protein
LITWATIWTLILSVQPAGIKRGVQYARSTGKEPKMRRIHRFSISKEDLFNMLHAGRYNPCLQITYRDRFGKHTHKLTAGYWDDIDVYREGTETYILSSNSKLGYVGLEIFEGAEKQGEIFLQEEQIKDVLGRDDLAPFNAIKRLREYIT